MKIGFIGAGKAGNSLARHLTGGKVFISGFYSKTYANSKQAADYVQSVAFLSLKNVVEESDMIFITTPDGEIGKVSNEIRRLPICTKDKYFYHCSGSLSSTVLGDLNGCSAHPMQAISSKETNMQGTFFTLEGNERAVEAARIILKERGNPITVIKPENKIRYHGAASIASNLVVGLVQMAIDELESCGIDKADALSMLSPLIKGNVDNICRVGPVNALTGPVERGDAGTVEAHLNAFDGKTKQIYGLISHKLVEIAENKNQGRDYHLLKELLEDL